MSSLGDSLWRQLGGSVPANPRDVANYLIQKHGSGRAAARAVGVDEASIRRWKSGQTKGSVHVEEFARHQREERASRHGGEIGVNLKHAKRDRNLSFAEGAGNRGLDAGTLDRVRDAYVAGDREGMADAFMAGLPAGFYSDVIRDATDAERGEFHGYMADGTAGAGEDSGAVGVIRA